MSPAARPPLSLVTRSPSAGPALGTAGLVGLDEAFRAYSAYVAYIGVRILGQDDDIDDLVQDVFVQAARGLRGLKEAGAIKGWLGTITVRMATRRLRVRRLTRVLGLSELPNYDQIVWPGADPEKCATIARIYELLDRAPPKHRAAWILRMVEGEAVDDVARLCDCSRATAKRWVQSVQTLIDEGTGHA